MEKQGAALGALGGMNGIAAVLGPNVGSFILDITGQWHWLFLINLPIAVVVLVAGWKMIQESREDEAYSLDYAGIVLLALSILGVMYGLTNLSGVDLMESFLQPDVYGIVLAGVALFIVLLFWERRVVRRQRDPILPIRLMKRPNYLLALLLGAFSGAILASVIFIPAYVEQVLGVSASKAGYFYTPLALASGIGAGGGGALVDRKGPIFAMVLAGVLSFIGAILFPLWVTETWQMIVASCVLGMGFGIMLGAPINMLATENTDNKGTALGTMSLFRQIGMTLGPTIYAGFIARAFLTLGDRIEENLAEAGVDPSALPAAQLGGMENMEYPEIVAQIQQIPVPPVREAILGALHDAVSSGYGNLYMAAAVVSALSLLTTITLHFVRKQKAAAKAEG
jgi:MFS family permease